MEATATHVATVRQHTRPPHHPSLHQPSPSVGVWPRALFAKLPLAGVYLKGCLPLTRGVHDMAGSPVAWAALGKFLNILYMQSIRELVFSLIQLPIFCAAPEPEPPVGVILWQFRKEGSRPILHRPKKKNKGGSTHLPSLRLWRQYRLLFKMGFAVVVVIVTLTLGEKINDGVAVGGGYLLNPPRKKDLVRKPKITFLHNSLVSFPCTCQLMCFYFRRFPHHPCFPCFSAPLKGSHPWQLLNGSRKK